MNKKILIIDDNIDFLNDIGLMLSNFYHIYQAENSRSGYYYFKHYRPDLCLIDIQLNPYINPEADLEGLYLTREIQDISEKPVNIILMSRYDIPPPPFKLNYYAFLKKPFLFKTLKLYIDNALKTSEINMQNHAL